MATTSWDVGPTGLSTTRMPSISSRGGRRWRPRRRLMRRRCRQSALDDVTRLAACARTAARGLARWAARRSRPAARACPPPPNAPVRAMASTPPSRVRVLIACVSPRSRNRMATSAVADWASRSMSPRSAPAPPRPCSRSIGCERRPDEPSVALPSPAARARCRTAAAARWAWCDRAPRRCRPAARRPRCSSAATRSVRGVTLGCWNVAVSPTMPAIRSRRDGAPDGIERHAQARQQQRHHLARRGRLRVDPVDGAEAGVGARGGRCPGWAPDRTARRAPGRPDRPAPGRPSRRPR